MTRPLILAALLLATSPAQAHKLKVFASAEGALIVGSAYFAGGAPARMIGGEVQAPDGSRLGGITTDDDGGFRFPVRSRMDHTITFDAGDGHVARTVVVAAEMPPSLPPGMASAEASAPARPVPTDAGNLDAVEAAVARQIRPLRQQLDAYEDRTRLHDVLGGIGIIFGLFGTAAWLSTKRRTGS